MSSKEVERFLTNTGLKPLFGSLWESKAEPLTAADIEKARDLLWDQGQPLQHEHMFHPNWAGRRIDYLGHPDVRVPCGSCGQTVGLTKEVVV